jgi:hypothetical protein
LIRLLIGKKGKTETALREFLDQENSFYFSETISVNGAAGLCRSKEIDFPEEKKERFKFMVTDFSLKKIGEYMVTNRIRNATLYLDGELLTKHNLKEIKTFSFMNNCDLIITVNSQANEEIITVEL